MADTERIEITRYTVASAVERALGVLASKLADDVQQALVCAYAAEQNPQAKCALGQLCQNAAIAAQNDVPLCQDCGYVWVCLEIGPDVQLAGDVFADVNGVVAACYKAQGLRMSMVCDAFGNRANSTDNTPAFCEVHFSDVPGQAQLHVMLKGGGSDNASRVIMLEPGKGRAGIKDAVLACVREKGANACPPLTVGIGIGATFDKVGGLAKQALLRPVGTRHADAHVAAFEEELLDAINASGVGAAGLGGNHTALDVHIETAPCHIAAMPVAINLGCNSLRRMSIDLLSGVSTPSFAGVAGVPGAQGDEAGAQADAGRALSLPLTPEDVQSLRAGDVVTLSGSLYTLRDAGHMRLLDELNEQGSLPYGLAGQTIFYCGPSPARGNQPFGACGPTTASRMDFAAPALYGAGIVATIGKGRRSADVQQACATQQAVYFTCTGGAAALLARCVKSAQLIAYGDLGTEALRRLEVESFPCVVAIDAFGGNIYDD